MKLKIGQSLSCLNGEKVIITEIEIDAIVVKYRGKLYKRPFEIIGQKLFINEEEPHITNTNNIKDEEKINVESKTVIYSCKDCLVSVRGDCFGENEICKHFKVRPRVSLDEIAYWPTAMQGPY